MKTGIKILIGLILLNITTLSFSQSKIEASEISEKMQWFSDAKLGIFIHTGIYAVDGIGESWSFHNKRILHSDYMKQLKGFTLNNYDPAYWAELIKETGARYAVITTKHHDGVAMGKTRRWSVHTKYY